MPRQVIFIMTDTQGANCVGAYGDKNLQTPRIDQLAAEGVRFDQAYTTCPVCTAARGALFTGCYPHTNGAMGNEIPLNWNTRTIGERLQAAGVKTAYTGKWHLTALDYFDMGVCPNGWDPEYWFDGRNHLESLPEKLRTVSREYQTTETYQQHGFTTEHTFAHGVTERARKFLANHTGQDFFLAVSYDEPHHPSMAPPPFSDLHAGAILDTGEAKNDTLEGKPELQKRWAERVKGHDTRRPDGTYQCQPYFASNTFVDHEIGRVVDAIDEFAPDALVIYTSDHGEMMHAHQLHSKGPAMYHEITRIPFIARWPGQIAPGSVAPAPLSQLGLTPAMLDFFGLECPPGIEGESFLPRLRNPALSPDAPIFMEFNRFGGNQDELGLTPIRCAFDGRYKLSINLFDRDELYDLREDPAENVNRIDDPALADHRDRLHQAIINEMYRTHDLFRGRPWEERSWTRGNLVVPQKPRRFYRPDGFMPQPLHYSTGFPPEVE